MPKQDPTSTDRTHAPPPQPGTTGPDRHAALSSAVRAVSGVTLLSRVGGLVRDLVLVRLFGDTQLWSAFSGAFAVPNLFRRLFGEGALSAAFLPEYARRQPASAGSPADPPPDGAHPAALAGITLAGLAAVTGLVTALLELALLAVLLAGNPAPDRRLALELVMVMLPFMPAVCLAAILAGMLQAHGRFAAAASGPLVLNAFIIGTGLWSLVTGAPADRGTALVIAAATVLSGFTQAAGFAWMLRAHLRGAGPSSWTAPVRAAAARMARRFGPVALGMGAQQLSAFLDTLIAMWPVWIGATILGAAYPLDVRAAGILASAQRLYQFPLGVFGIAVATAVFPLLARARDHDDFAGTLRRGVRLAVCIGLPASAGLMLIGHDIARVLFSGGAESVRGYSPEGVARAGRALAGYAPAIWAYSLNHVLTRAFYARADTATPSRVAALMILVGFAGNALLVWPLAEAGLAWATSITACIQCAALLHLARRRLGVAPVDRAAALALARLALATAVMALAVEAAARTLPVPGSWRADAARLAALCLLGAGTYAGACLLLRAPEPRWLLARERPASSPGA